MSNFNELGLAEPILRAVSGEGYTNPTPIQGEVIPAMLEGRDILGIAQTGTGKTAAFVLPLLNALAAGGKRAEPRNCRALILAPTRELAAQIAASIRTYGKHMRHSVAVVVGGAKPGPQVKALAGGIDIVVATPGRLLDHMNTGAIRLDKTSQIVLDEADQMLDLGFMPAIRRIMGKLPAERQTVLLSATMPKQIRGLANDFLKRPAEISVAPVSRPIERIEQKVMLVDKAAKNSVLADLLGAADVERAIVFTRTKRGADKVQKHLGVAGFTSAAIHGDKSQGQRERALRAFKAGQVTVLVATDIAARGIDIDDVSHVVNYELPNVPEAYVHRIGRTARAGKSGVAISLCDREERGLLRDIERLIGRSLGATPVEGGDRSAEARAPRPAVPATEPRAKHGEARKGGQGRHKPNKFRGKPASAEQARRRAKKPHGGGANAGLERMLGNVGL